MTQPEMLLYWTSYDSMKPRYLTKDGRDYLIGRLFRNKKSISNALYVLKTKGYMVKAGDDWHVTDLGKAYIDSIFKDEGAKSQEQVRDWEDEDAEDDDMEDNDLPYDSDDADFFAEAEGVEDEDDTAPDEASYVNDAYKYMAQAFQHMADAFKHMNDVFKLM